MEFSDWLFENGLWLTEPGRSQAERFKFVWDAALTQARAEEREKCARAVCYMCNDADNQPRRSADGHYYHEKFGVVFCAASGVHELE